MSGRGLVFADGHAHSNPVQGMGAEVVARKFAEKGGWFMALVALPPYHYGIQPRTVDDYRRAFDLHISECRRASGALRVSCLAGFHPAEVDALVSSGFKPEEALELGIRVVDMVVDLCRKGLLDGIGEVGRQHYKTAPERMAVAYTVAQYALARAKDEGCLVHLHLENAGPATVATIDHFMSLINGRRDLVLFHHSTVRVAGYATQKGYSATVPGKREQLRAALERIGPVFIPESDYIDDPRRPCVSSCPWEIVERQLSLLEQGSVAEEALWRINVDNVVRFYRVEPP